MYKGAGANNENIVTVDEMPLFKEALLAPIRDIEIRVTALDSGLVKIQDITPDTIEGTVYVDTSRATRRTCQLRFIDKDGSLTPLNSNAIFYWDKLIKIEYGLKVNGAYKYVPLGIFSIDRVEVIAENGAAVLNLDGSDLWKRLSDACFSQSRVYGKGWAPNTTYNEIITDCAVFAGIPTSRILLDPLSSRATTADKQIGSRPLAYEIGDNIGESLKKWTEDWAIDIYFDVNGNLITRDKTQPPYVGDPNYSPDASFTAGENAVMLGVSKAQSSDTIKNHIVVIADNSGKVAIRGEYIEGKYDAVTAPLPVSNTSTLIREYNGLDASGLSVNKLGYRTQTIRTTTLFTASQCIARAKVELAKNLVVEEQIRLPLVVNPLFDGHDLISVTESNVGLDNQTYTLDAFDIPMRSSRQELTVKKTRSLS